MCVCVFVVQSLLLSLRQISVLSEDPESSHMLELVVMVEDKEYPVKVDEERCYVWVGEMERVLHSSWSMGEPMMFGPWMIRR